MQNNHQSNNLIIQKKYFLAVWINKSFYIMLYGKYEIQKLKINYDSFFDNQYFNFINR